MLDIALGVLFGPQNELEEAVLLESDAFADREQIRFRFRGRNLDGPMIVEQHAYLAERDGLIAWMRIVCSGQRPTPDSLITEMALDSLSAISRPAAPAGTLSCCPGAHMARHPSAPHAAV